MKFFSFISCLLLMVFAYGADFLKNPDQPIKGQWQFSPSKIWEQDSAGDEILVNISRIRIDVGGNVYVLDSRRNKIHVFDKVGKHKFSFARKGEGPGEIKDAYDFYLFKDTVMVPDGTKVHYFKSNGEYKKSITTPEMLLPYLFLDEERMVAIPLSSIVQRDKTQPRDVFLYHLTSGAKKKMFHVPRVKALRYSGGGIRLVLKMPDEILEELFMALGPKYIFYGYSDTYTIHKLDYSGKECFSFSIDGRPRQKLSSKGKKIILEKATEKHSNIPKDVMNKVAEQFPDELPYFHHLYVEIGGLVYVLRSNILNPHIKDVDIFSEEGKYLYRGNLTLEKGCAFIQFAIKKNALLVFVEDSDGERKLVKYTITIPSSS